MSQEEARHEEPPQTSAMQGSRTDEVMTKPHPSLWDRAYDSLRSESAQLLRKFEKILWKELQKADDQPLSSSKKQTLEEADYQISLLTTKERQSHLNRLISYNLENISGKKNAVRERLGQAAEVALWVNDWMKAAAQASPEAAVAWTAICVALPLLTKPAAEEKAYKDGFVYVTSRMQYYAALEGLMLSKDTGLMKVLETHIIDLYHSILEFQIKGILRHDRNALTNFGRDLIQRDGWENMHKGIKELERCVNEDSRHISLLKSELDLEKLVREAEHSRETLLKYLQIAEQHLAMSQENLEIDRRHLKVSENQLSVQEQILKKLSREEEECLQLFRLENVQSGHSYEWYKVRTEDRIDGTCEWFLNHENFTSWLNQDSGPLLVSADPGCGKSVLAKYLIDHWLPRSTTICYFFFKDQVQNTLKQALCALIHQLLSARPLLVRHALPNFSKNGPGLVNVIPSLWNILNKAAQDLEAGPIVFVLDALDECLESEFRPLAKMLRDEWVKQTNSFGKVKWLLTSRPYEQITCEFQELIKEFPYIRIPGEEKSGQISQEVNHVIKHRVNRLATRMRLGEDVRNHLEARLLGISHRTYLWVYLVFDHLEKGFKKTKKGVEKEIATLPESVNEAYEKILCKSSNERKARKALCIVLASRRPLTLKEMNVAVNIESSPRTERFEDLDLESEEDFEITLRGWCGLFLSIYSRQVYFLHQTAREFLIQESTPAHTSLEQPPIWGNSFSLQQANRLLTEVCMTYLKFEDLHDDSGGSELEKRLTFLQFSAKNWGRHFKQASINESHLVATAIELCDGQTIASRGWLRVYGRENPILDLTIPLHILSCLGIRQGVEKVLEQGLDIETKDDQGATALHIAAWAGEDKVAALLIEKGAGIDVRGTSGQTALYKAAVIGRTTTVALLLEKGAGINIKAEYGSTALYQAALDGYNDIVALLLEKGAKIDIQNTSGLTALYGAALDGHTDTVALLLEKGAKIDIKDKTGLTAFYWAALDGHTDTAALLLEKGADINIQNTNGMTALNTAAFYGKIDTVALLLEKGADINIRDADGSTALHAVALGDKTDIATLLLKKGAGVNIQDKDGKTPLDYTHRKYGNESVRQMLRAHGAERGEDLVLEPFNEFWSSLEGLPTNTQEDTIQGLPSEAGTAS